MTKVTLTPEQIQNWRAVLCGLVGPYALLMTPEQIQQIRDKMEDVVNKPEGESEE